MGFINKSLKGWAVLLDETLFQPNGQPAFDGQAHVWRLQRAC